MERVLLLLKHRGNANLLAELLAVRYRVESSEPGAPLPVGFDLCICDGPMLHERQQELAVAKAAAGPVFLPLLLIASRGRALASSHHWWQVVDELIMRPIDKAELLARTEMLLRARRLSRALQASTEALRHARDLLEAQVAERTHELAEANAQLRAEIAERMAAGEQLRLHAQVFDSNAEAAVILDAQRHILTVNSAFSTITGYGRDEVVGREAGLVCGASGPGFLRTLWRTIADKGAWQGEVSCRRKNAEVFPAWLSASAVRNEDGELTHYIALLSDLAERKRTEARLDFLSNYDFLTGLPNVELLHARFSRALAERRGKAQGMSLLIVDLDHFKYVNESLGHPLGDRLLKRMGRRLRLCAGPEATVSRQGGDEFIVLSPAVTIADAARLAGRLLGVVRRPCRVRGHELSLTASIGISSYPADGGDLDTLLKNADAALHHAKTAGHNGYQFFRAEMNARAVRRLTLENALRRALEREEFELYFQPQMEIRSGALIGAEALLRWRHPGRGLIGPGQFIPVAEDAGLIPAIGQWVLFEACRQARRWQNGRQVPVVAVNLSALQFRQGRISLLVRRALESAGLAPAALELELTESVLMDEPEAAIAILHQLKDMGLRLALDDFGTGYSSLSYLKRFPLDKLKIDQSFVRDLAHDANDAAIVVAVISLARSLQLRVIAEGVENPEQLAFLRAHQCDEIQGYLFSPPLAADAFRVFAGRHAGSLDARRCPHDIC